MSSRITLSCILGLLGAMSATQVEGQPLLRATGAIHDKSTVEVAIETVVVGNPGNPGEQSRTSSGDFTFYGGVAYTYAIGKYEVTAGQYTAFLNAVAASDAHGLYNIAMDYDANPDREGCNIKRQDVPGGYTYSVASDWANRPVNYVSWADAARFANWMHNGQPSGTQDLTSTEDGSYFLNGISEVDDEHLEDVVREFDATWVIPSEDEWYKAAYHKNDGVTGNYWNYPTGADGGISNQLIDPDPGNNATFSDGQVRTIGAPYFRTEVGAHENSESPYGTFDQGGNVMEFTEAVPWPDIRRIRGGSWFWGRPLLSSSEVDDVMHSSDQFYDLGFRLVRLGQDPSSTPATIPNERLGFGVSGAHPFRDEARFSLDLPEAGRVRIEIFDVAGRRMPASIDETMHAGVNEVRVATDELAPGIYLARVHALDRSQVAQFVIR